ncbi:MAG: tetratricopeptide repeat protein [Bacteroidia bacterium]
MLKGRFLFQSWLTLVSSLITFTIGCSPHLPELDEIDELQKKLRVLLNSQGAQSSVFMTTALELARKEEAFVKKYPNHPVVPKLLIESAEIYGTYFGDAQKAVELLREVDRRFRHKSPLAPKALFYEAFLYETMLNDTAKARQRYEDFLQYYPDHELARDARLSIQNLGRSPSELMQQILKQSQSPQ